MLDCFLRSTFDRGLSTVDAEDPDTRDGVRVLPGTSSLGRREDEVCTVGLEVVNLDLAWVMGTVGVVLPWRALTTPEDFKAGPL